MKTAATFTTIAAFIAFVVAQFSFQVSVSLLFAAGFFSIFAADYGRVFRPVTSSRSRVLARLPERLPLAS